MIKEAEEFKEEDNKMKEKIEAKNSFDSLYLLDWKIKKSIFFCAVP